MLCEYDQVDQPHALKRHAELDSGELAKMLGILVELKLTNEIAKCPLQPTVDLLTFGYADGSRVTLRIGCAMVWRSEKAHAMLSDLVSNEVDAIKEVLSRWDGKSDDTLAQNEQHQYIQNQCKPDNGEPFVKLFINPMGLIQAGISLAQSSFPQAGMAAGFLHPAQGDLDAGGGGGGAQRP